MERLIAILLFAVIAAVLLAWDAPIEQLAVKHKLIEHKDCASRGGARPR